MQRICEQCSSNFDISDEDLKFYEKLSPVFNNTKYFIPAPVLCPSCRYQRRLVHRNERNLYLRKCDATNKDIVSIFSPEKTIKVYSQDYWWSDKWDAKSYGKDFNFSRPFFEQFKELFQLVPQITLNNFRSENSEYTNQSQDNKNSYLIVASNHNEDCYYGMWLQQCLNSVDCLYLEKGELCYEVVNAKNCYNVQYSENIEGCSDSYFLKDCIACKNCFGCVNLRNKEYFFFNQQLSKEEYEEKMKNLELIKNASINKLKHQFDEYTATYVNKYYHGKNIENSTGDYIQEIKNSSHVFNCRNSEDIKYCYDAWDARDCYDLTETLTNESSLELEGSVYTFMTAFCMKVDHVSDVYYSSHCYTGKYLFGCIGLRNSEYCILNKQYSKEDYEMIVPKIINHMMTTKEWGHHFPKEISPFGYNESVAQEYFPFTKEEAMQKTYKWKNVDEKQNLSASYTIDVNAEQIPENIIKEILHCQNCKKNYRIIPQELKFYQKLSIPLPTVCPDCRHKARMAKRNSREIYNRKCMKCNREIQSTYAPNNAELVYCEDCYLKEVY